MLQVNDHRLLKFFLPLHRPRDYRRYVLHVAVGEVAQLTAKQTGVID